jgi:hypothetical protein
VVGFGLKKEMKIKEHRSVFPYRDNYSMYFCGKFRVV